MVSSESQQWFQKKTIILKLLNKNSHRIEVRRISNTGAFFQQQQKYLLWKPRLGDSSFIQVTLDTTKGRSPVPNCLFLAALAALYLPLVTQ